MTKKEKKELALKIKAEIEAKKPKPEKTEIISKEQMERNNHVRYSRAKARTMKAAKIFREAKDKYMDDYNKW
jgi:hypothetical protein